MLTKQFLKRDIAVRVVGPGGQVDWATVGPQDADADFDVRIQAGDESVTKQQDRADKIAFLNAVLPLAQAGIVNFQPILIALAEDFGFPNPEAIVSAATQAGPPPAAPFTTNGGGSPPGGSSPFILGTNGGAAGVPQLAPQPLSSILQGNQQ
jgi:hypothetical protein